MLCTERVGADYHIGFYLTIYYILGGGEEGIGRRLLALHCITSSYSQTSIFFSLFVVIDVSLLGGAKSKASQGTNV